MPSLVRKRSESPLLERGFASSAISHRKGALRKFVRASSVTMLCVVGALACGSRTELMGDPFEADELSTDAAIDAPFDRQPPPQSCKQEGQVAPCGSNVGECRFGTWRCENGLFDHCEGGVLPSPETCNGLDDDCDGVADNGFNLGQACDGPDKDLCADDVMTCGGCSQGKDDLETCNGRDDDCDGIVDSDCETGGCSPSLLVTGSTPSSPSCTDFPVAKGSGGRINYPCTGGAVSANIGNVAFSGTSKNNHVVLTGSVIDLGPDGCTWEFTHRIEGDLPSGQLAYSYSERVVKQNGRPRCWSPCTEAGSVKVTW